jgi:hypothetical protein
MKTCAKCKQSLDDSYFRIDSQGRNGESKIYLRPECKKCEKKINNQLKTARQLASVKPLKCECCKQIDKLVVDHDHTTGKFRGWLCKRCNLGIGKLGDNLEGLKKAVKYLESSHSSTG